MEDSRKVFKFEGEPGEDFRLWEARTEAALEAEEVLAVVIKDVIGDGRSNLNPQAKLSVAKARATIIQGLGEKPLRMCMNVRDNPFKMIQRLKERYAVVNVSTKVQLQTQLARVTCKDQVITEYVSGFEELFNRLSAAVTGVDQDLRVAMLLASYGDKNKSRFGRVIASLQSSQESLTWDSVTARLIQEYDEQTWASENMTSSEGRDPSPSIALSAGHSERTTIKRRLKKTKHYRDKMRCFGCGKVGHIVRKCPGKKKYQSQYHHSNGIANHAVMLMAVQQSNSERELILDSGASDHMVCDMSYLFDVESIIPKQIVIGNGSVVTASRQGKMSVKFWLTGNGSDYEHTRVLRKVLFVPDLDANLVSCAVLCRDAYELKFKRESCVALKDDMIEFQGRMRCGVFTIDGEIQSHGRAFAALKKGEALWHDRLGHAHKGSIRELAKKSAVTGLNLDSPKTHEEECDGCAQGKQQKLSIHQREKRATKIGEVIHSDLSGKISTKSLRGAHYYVSFIDEYSGYIVVAPIERKSDVLSAFKRYHKWFERKYDCRIKRLHSDGGGEYTALDNYLKEHEIEMNDLPSFCPELNGIAERGTAH